MEIIETEDYLWYTINIWYDEHAESPRVSQDNFWTMVCNHERYNLWDEKIDSNLVSFEEDLLWLLYETRMYATENNKDTLESILETLNKEYLYIPLRLTDHSWISISTWGYQEHTIGGNFDSWMVWYIYVSKEKVMEELWMQEWSEEQLIKEAYSILEEEVKTYSQYLEWNIYSYQIEWMEDIDCSWWMWYYETDDAISEAKQFIDWQDPEGKIMKDGDRIYEIAMDAFWDTFNKEKESLYMDYEWVQDGDSEDLLTNIIWEKLKKY